MLIQGCELRMLRPQRKVLSTRLSRRWLKRFWGPILYNFALIQIHLNSATEKIKLPTHGCEPDLLRPQHKVLTTRLSTPMVRKVFGTNNIQLCFDS